MIHHQKRLTVTVLMRGTKHVFVEKDTYDKSGLGCHTSILGQADLTSLSYAS